MPANGGLLRIGYPSPGSETGRSGSEIANSLRRIFEIFPFSGDRGRRPGSIYTACPASQSCPRACGSPGKCQRVFRRVIENHLIRTDTFCRKTLSVGRLARFLTKAHQSIFGWAFAKS